MYPEYCRDTFTRYVTVPRADDFTIDLDGAMAAIDEHQPDVVLLASPNNPTGTVLPLEVVRGVLGAAPGMVVVDEAYAEFRHAGTPSALELLADHPRLVVTRTMSKAFALAGARLGYLAASPAVVQAVQLVRLPYHLSAVTQAVARAALAHTDELQSQVALLRAERDALVDWLRARGHAVADSDANFVLFGRFDDRHAVWQGLLDRGVLIRETGPGRMAAGQRRHARRERGVPRRSGGGHRMSRSARVQRTTKESDVLVELDIDGTGVTEIETGVPFFDHMLAQIGKHGGFDLTVRTAGDLEVDAHHTVEDTSLALGSGAARGARRQGGHPPLRRRARAARRGARAGGGRPVRPALPRAHRARDRRADRQLRHHADQAHLRVDRGRGAHHAARHVLAGRNAHHVVETQFKAFARALRTAVEVDPRVVGVPSTKGSL